MDMGPTTHFLAYFRLVLGATNTPPARDERATPALVRGLPGRRSELPKMATFVPVVSRGGTNARAARFALSGARPP